MLVVILLLGLFAILASASSVSAASTVYVNATVGSDDNPGTIDLPYLTIGKGISNVEENGTVQIADGTYSGKSNTNLSIGKNMTITGQNQNKTIINGTGANWIFKVNAGVTVTIANLTLTNTTTKTNGGAINNGYGGTLTLNNCAFTNNKADSSGGAIYNKGSNTILTVNNSIFTNNKAGTGGAIYNEGSILTVNNSIFTNNTADTGGAIYTYEGQAIVNSSTFTNNNVSYGNGGAIYNGYDILTVNNSTFTNNTAYYGGAIYNEGSSSILTVNNSTFTNNTAYAGGAIYDNSNSTINNSTFTNNTADRGGAIYNINTLTINNSTFTNNHANGMYGYGGAIFNYSKLTINKSTFTNNTATSKGGSIDSEGRSSSLTANFNRFYNDTATNVSTVYCTSGNVENNWWGTNTPNSDWDSFISGGISSPASWVILSVNITPNSINNAQNSTVTADFNHYTNSTGYIGTLTDHIPEGTIKLDINSWGSFTSSGTTQKITLNTVNGLITATYYANGGAAPANPVKITATSDSYTTNNTESAYININKTVNLYLNITSNNNNPNTGKNFTVTYKLGNYGPDNATNVTITIPLPNGFTVSNISGDGNWTITGKTITWTLTNVPVGDPYLYVSGWLDHSGNFVFNSSITSENYNITRGVTPLTINTAENDNITPIVTPSTNNTAKAASNTRLISSKTVGMQNTGLPIAWLIVAIFAVFGGLLTPKRK